MSSKPSATPNRSNPDPSNLASSNPASSDPASVSSASSAAARKLLVAPLLALFMALVAISVINVALPAIRGAFDASSSSLQWVISGYALAFGVLLVPAGRAGDVLGRRRVLLAGIALFTAGSLLAGLAPNVLTLNLARVLQGFGSGLVNPQTIGLIQQHFRGQARARAFALMGTTVAVATAIGPVIGGLLIQLLGPNIGWRWMFFMNVPVGLAALVLGLRWVPDDRVRTQQKLDLDPVGTILLALSVLALMLPFMERSVGPIMWLMLPVAAALLIGWVRWERHYGRRGHAPMVDLAIFSSAAFRNGIAIITVFFMGATSIWILIPIYLQSHLHHSAFEASIVGLPSSIAAMFSSQIAGRYVMSMGRRLVVAGFLVAALSLLGVILLAGPVESKSLPFWVIAVPLTLMGVAQGMTIAPNQTLTLSSVDPRFGGVAGGILSLGQRVGTAVGTALIPGVLFSLVEGGTSWPSAFRVCLGLIVALTLLACAFSAYDRKREKAAAADTTH